LISSTNRSISARMSFSDLAELPASDCKGDVAAAAAKRNRPPHATVIRLP
jgi:hypothetical protein